MVKQHLCEIPCGSMPVISETNFGKVTKPLLHLDRSASFSVLIYVVEGEMEIFEDGIPYLLTADTLFFLKSGVHHWGEKPFLQGTSWYYVHFEFPNVAQSVEKIYKNKMQQEEIMDIAEYKIILPKIINFAHNPAIKYLIKQIVTNYNTGRLMHASLLLWNVLYDCFEKDSPEHQSESYPIKINQLMHYLEEFYYKKITHEEIEMELGLSYKYLSALLKECLGKTIKQYQLSIRLKKTVELLCESSLSIAEISRETGFYDEFYFSKIFKREFGMPPSQYRQIYTTRI
ncbi:AraC-type DNA-binding protein [Amphibacillus marinus]|uniref:AraC-type DNA-binding protein n=1 Tax=Amphibacillus marinus TaxID=872970 RepID=A0A1H8L6U9_9BACI|nr:AraC family transcriptional regulator [Amphibacillus marinus]SEO00847.1 AraC-type DNA-binding protein [Amphibacillus marinus]